MASQRGAVSITIGAFSGKLRVSILTRMRKAVVERLVTLGGTQENESLISGIPLRYLDRVKEVFAEEYAHWTISVHDLRPQPVVEGGKVAWNMTENRHSRVWHGYLGKIEVFTTASVYDRETMSYLFHLNTSLPGYSRQDAVAKTKGLEESQVIAEEVIMRWLEKTGLAGS
jgi:hypothetical protein